MTALANLTRTKALIAVTAVLAVVLIATIASCGGPGGSSATGFHDPKTLTASVLTQGVAAGNQGTAKPQCVTPGHQVKDADRENGVLRPGAGMAVACRDGVAVAQCPGNIEAVVVCQFDESSSGNSPVNLRVTVAKDGLTYSATGPNGVALTDGISG